MIGWLAESGWFGWAEGVNARSQLIEKRGREKELWMNDDDSVSGWTHAELVV